MDVEGVMISNDGYGTPGKADLGTSEVNVIFTKIQICISGRCKHLT